MNSGTFLEQAKSIVTGNGFLRDVQIPFSDCFLASSGAALTTTLSTNPGRDLFDTAILGLSWAAAKVVKAGIAIRIPKDYDQSEDHCKLVFRAKMSGSTDTTTALDAVAYHEDDGTTDLDPTISADLTASLADVKIDLSGNGFVAGDHITVQPFPEAHGTDAVQVYSISLEYRSSLVYFDKDSAR